MGNLDNTVQEEIEALSAQGSDLFDDGDFTQAIAKWEAALTLIPHPQNTYAESQWLETAIGDAYFCHERFSLAVEHLLRARSNVEANPFESPFLMLRLGQPCYQLKRFEEAKLYLLQAYMYAGEELFEDEDDCYLPFIFS